VTGSKVAGVDAAGAAWLRLCGDDVSATVAGGLAISVSASTGPVVVGDPAAGCAANRVAAGATFAGNTGGVTIAGNILARGLTVTDGRGPTVLRGNTLFGPLACAGNDPAPVNGGQVNSAPSKTGQCVGL
jgi:arabinoxylan arabinofuranohydrolase